MVYEDKARKIRRQNLPDTEEGITKEDMIRNYAFVTRLMERYDNTPSEEKEPFLARPKKEESPALFDLFTRTDIFLSSEEFTKSKPFLRYKKKTEAMLDEIMKQQSVARWDIVKDSCDTINIDYIGNYAVFGISKSAREAFLDYLMVIFYGSSIMDENLINLQEGETKGDSQKGMFLTRPQNLSERFTEAIAPLCMESFIKTARKILAGQGEDAKRFLAELIVHRGTYTQTGVQLLFEDSFTEACMREIRKKMARDAAVTIDNIHTKGLPDMHEAIDILQDTFLIGAYRLCLMIVNPCIELSVRCGQEILDKAYEEAISDFEEEFRNLSEKLDAATKENARLQELTKREDPQIKRITARNEELERDAKNLRHELSQLKKELDAYKEEEKIEEEAEAETEEEETVDYEFGIDSNILFVADKTEFAKTFNQIQKTFPNATITNDIQGMKNGRYDLAVLLTRCISAHSYYWRAKKLLKEKGVPLIHIRSANANQILYEIQHRPAYRS